MGCSREGSREDKERATPRICNYRGHQFVGRWRYSRGRSITLGREGGTVLDRNERLTQGSEGAEGTNEGTSEASEETGAGEESSEGAGKDNGSGSSGE